MVQLYNTKAFENGDLWRYAADFKSPAGLRMGFKMTRLTEGSGEISVYFDPGVTDDLKVMFIKYVHEHLLEKAQDVTRLRRFVCPHCDYPLKDSELAREILEEDGIEAEIRCQRRKCDRLFPLWDLIEQKFASEESKQQVRDLEEKAKAAIDSESQELILVGHAFSIAGEAGQDFRQTPNNPWGLDGEIELKDWEGNPSSQCIYLQLKLGESYDHEHRNGQELFTIKNARLRNHWQKQAYPIMLVNRSPDGQIRWMDISAYLKEKNAGKQRQSLKIIFNGEPFTALNLQRLRDRLIPPVA